METSQGCTSGMRCFRVQVQSSIKNRGEWCGVLREKLHQTRILEMSDSEITELLNGGAIDLDSVVMGDNPVSGGWLAHYDKNFDPLPIWIGGKITVMAQNTKEQAD